MTTLRPRMTQDMQLRGLRFASGHCWALKDIVTTQAWPCPPRVAAARARPPISSRRWRHPCSVRLPVGLPLTFLACNATIALR